ncbi:MAG: hypothetical protein ACFFEE_09520 [Candidatus Thorarchaeota archaeon]
MYLWKWYKVDLEFGVTVFKFDYPASPEQFIATVREWMALTKEGIHYIMKNPEEDTILKIQRGRGLITAPIVFEFKVRAASSRHTEIIVVGYVKMFAINRLRQALKPDATIGLLPRRNGWKDMLKLIEYSGITFYDYGFYPSLEFAHRMETHRGL